MDVRDNDKLKQFEKVPCEHCGKFKTFEGHDGCLGTLDGLGNACCSHGNPEHAYVQFFDGTTIKGEDAVLIQEILKRNRSGAISIEKLVWLAGACKFIAQEVEGEKGEVN